MKGLIVVSPPTYLKKEGIMKKPILAKNQDAEVAEIISSIHPYIRIGQFIFDFFNSLNSEDENSEYFEEIFNKLDELKILIKSSYEHLERILNDIPLRERSGEVQAISELLLEIKSIKDRRILIQRLGDIEARSATTKKIIISFISSPYVLYEYKIIYFSLLTTLVPLRIASFKLYKNNEREIGKLVKDEFQELIALERQSKDITKVIGERRVSSIKSSRTILDEMIPSFILHYYVFVDGDLYTLGFYEVGQGRKNGLPHDVDKIHTAKRDSIIRGKINHTEKPFIEFYKSLKKLIS